MAVTEISAIKYGKLLSTALPKVIETRDEFDRAVEMMEALHFPERTLSPKKRLSPIFWSA